MQPRALLCLVAVGLAILASAAACEDPEAYIFTARRYDAVGQCVYESVPIEQVTGPGADANCRARCMRVNDILYISTVCPPLPENAKAVESSDPECAAALAAATVTCDKPSDGGTAEEDAGEEPEDDAGASDAGSG